MSSIDDLNVQREMVERYEAVKTEQSIRAGEWPPYDLRPQDQRESVGRSHFRGTRYRGKTKTK